MLDRVRSALRARHYSPRTERSYVSWIRQFILFHGKRHPNDMDKPEITEFLSYLASRRKVSASTQAQALSALLFLYRGVLGRDLAWLDGIVRAKRPLRVPVVLTREEVSLILGHLHGTPWLMASLLYGAGVRVLECARLRIKDVELQRRELVIRDGKGRKDRITVLPDKLVQPLAAHIERTRAQHREDRRRGAGYVELPYALATKYPSAATEWAWQWVFPATRFYIDRDSGQTRRHHLHESVLQRAVKQAVRIAGIPKPATCHTLRHYAGCRIMPSSRPRAPKCLGFQLE